ncbi:uncharacterized protein PHACADRAFT_186867 [Phanerochaete carnosa HHB-10118-sp]|uniref:N-acetyltransferase domain-containing protein n=1 Tax=Phanerochaete carnosa (strain HHB-10118-sp) TaxID=650164 RepID=K5W156_PHACS|nr:uncharacterized protein PHACADRAFT_186867 [Phanerochaete carnosa HHB-10118-sp]EKM52805.1 hypothetical protein PHACADRAFT_186867 [Phanerochaete carnosa HHB-10118-sp]
MLYGVTESKDLNNLFCASVPREEVTPQLMQYKDVPKAYEVLKKSTASDPSDRYMCNTPDNHKKTKLWKAGRKAAIYLHFYKIVYDKTAWTINHGESLVNLGDPTRKESPLDKLINFLFVRLTGGIRELTRSEEQRKRFNEFMSKASSTAKEVLGDKISQMIEVDSLATAPERQGRGYASTLVRLATDLGDARGVQSWLLSSNTANRGFFHELGFEIVATFYLGDDNPTWTEQPIPVDIMAREPKGASGSMNEKAAGLELTSKQVAPFASESIEQLNINGEYLGSEDESRPRFDYSVGVPS